MAFVCGSILLIGSLVAALIAQVVGTSPVVLAIAAYATMLGFKLTSEEFDPHRRPVADVAKKQGPRRSV